MRRPPYFWFVGTLATVLVVAGCEPAIPVDPEALARLPAEVDYNYQGRRFRLTDVHGNVVHDLIA